MGEGMKSALELAMERARKLQGGEDEGRLSDAQKQRIAELRKEYEAKIAEKEIMLASNLQKMRRRTPPEEIPTKAQELQREFQEAKAALQREKEEKIAAARRGEGG
ncbi:MAG: hypothetical protein HYY96_04940 [Candidatus Tectomicrobia bacterium]|nr:hypothetical protein [Candidatus Tectomicrobia bacterium]